MDRYSYDILNELTESYDDSSMLYTVYIVHGQTAHSLKERKMSNVRVSIFFGVVFVVDVARIMN